MPWLNNTYLAPKLNQRIVNVYLFGSLLTFIIFRWNYSGTKKRIKRGNEVLRPLKTLNCLLNVNET